MTDSVAPASPSAPAPVAKTMEAIVALCRRRGFIFQSSEIYGGINGFWDYGPLGVELKRNLKEAWWHDIVRAPERGPDGQIISMVGVDCTIIMNPKVWVAGRTRGGVRRPDDRLQGVQSRVSGPDRMLAVHVTYEDGFEEWLSRIWVRARGSR